MEPRLDILRGSPFLCKATEDVLREIDCHGVETVYAPGARVFEEGSSSSLLFIILSGSVELTKGDGGSEFVLAQLGAGNFLGEMGILDDRPRSAGARAGVEGAVLLEFTKAFFVGLLSRQPELMLEMARKLSDRLRTGNVELQAKFNELAEAHHKLHRSYNTVLAALSNALDLRDQETEGHSRRVTAYSMAIARSIALPPAQREALRLGAILHDIGKIGVPDAILRKQGPLTDEEWGQMRQHPVWGAGIVRGVDFLSDALHVIESHHERWDGAGYPAGLKGEAIPLVARIFSVADVFDALTSVRSYKAAWAPERALEEIARNAGTQFDPGVVEGFRRAFPECVRFLQNPTDLPSLEAGPLV